MVTALKSHDGWEVYINKLMVGVISRGPDYKLYFAQSPMISGISLDKMQEIILLKDKLV